MPRQLPWAGRAGTQTTQPPRLVKKQRIVTDIDDDFFEGTVLATSSKGKGRADESDDGLADLPAELSTPRTKLRTKDSLPKKRAPSSSPPPTADLEQPSGECMQKGVSKFDLRDDEWMMVEDEFLETAKLFTRHLHIAEYEKLKEQIEEKKKMAEVARPVVANASMSFEGSIRHKAKAQEKRQKRAIHDVFASQDDGDEEDALSTLARFNKTTASFAGSTRAASLSSIRPGKTKLAYDSDNADLDAPRLPARLPTPKTAASPHALPLRRTAAEPKAVMTTPTPIPSFAKPAPPLPATKSRSRLSRATPFDILDDYVATNPTPNPTPTPEQNRYEAKVASKSYSWQTASATPGIASRMPTEKKASRAVDFVDEKKSAGMSKETADRLAKRRADAEKEELQKKRRAAKVADVPTFLW